MSAMHRPRRRCGVTIFLKHFPLAVCQRNFCLILACHPRRRPRELTASCARVRFHICVPTSLFMRGHIIETAGKTAAEVACAHLSSAVGTRHPLVSRVREPDLDLFTRRTKVRPPTRRLRANANAQRRVETLHRRYTREKPRAASTVAWLRWPAVPRGLSSAHPARLPQSPPQIQRAH